MTNDSVMTPELKTLVDEANKNLTKAREQKDTAARASIEAESIYTVLRLINEKRTLLTNHGYKITITKETK